MGASGIIPFSHSLLLHPFIRDVFSFIYEWETNLSIKRGLLTNMDFGSYFFFEQTVRDARGVSWVWSGYSCRWACDASFGVSPRVESPTRIPHEMFHVLKMQCPPFNRRQILSPERSPILWTRRPQGEQTKSTDWETIFMNFILLSNKTFTVRIAKINYHSIIF
jgi:hypothetical protein